MLGAGHSGVSYKVRIVFKDLADRETSVNMILQSVGDFSEYLLDDFISIAEE